MKSSENEISVLGSVLRALREDVGLSQEKLAEKASLHRTYIGSAERAERNISFKSLNRILKALNFSWSEFGEKIDEEFAKRKA